MLWLGALPSAGSSRLRSQSQPSSFSSAAPFWFVFSAQSIVVSSPQPEKSAPAPLQNLARGQIGLREQPPDRGRNETISVIFGHSACGWYREHG